MTEESQLREWLDRLAIQDLIARYSDAVTRADWDACQATFAPDAVWESPLGLRYDSAAEFVETLRATANFDVLIQTPSSPIVTLIDGGHAEATTTIHELTRGVGFADTAVSLSISVHFSPENPCNTAFFTHWNGFFHALERIETQQLSSKGTPLTDKPPTGLKTRGRGLWRTILETYRLDPAELVLLHELCRSVDKIQALDAEIGADGLLVSGSRGQIPRSHPLLLELRETQKTVSRLVAELALPIAGESVGVRRNPQQRQAAKVRWQRKAVRAHG